ncbi:ion channel [Acinetobacter nectaris]|uniref:ion channel n=1 Tax=Acinetobacter nectaris TaxID=1219382 RepID=UPI001F445934|nr:ion channel [Acinetobacter nectaris]MCF9034277.1 two pore domain potassium channel family protein [Acinetobacter nectaris]MCF9046566.1 two pore domain potassium channel family protein [Acinetobacter nectaris]
MAFSPLKRFIKHWKQLPSAWLLVFQLIILMMTFLPVDHLYYQLVMWGSGVLALLLIARVIKQTASFHTLGKLFISGAVLCLILMMVGGYNIYLQVGAHIFEIGAYISAAYSLLRYMFADRYLTKDELFAAGAVFTLLAWAFAYAYNICQLLVPNSFSNSIHPTSIQSWLDILFFSFSLQSATGLSNLLPLAPAVKVLSILQMFVGVMYLATIVSRLIALQYIHKASVPESEE